MSAMRCVVALLLLAFAVSAHAQPVQTQTEALAEDAEQYAAQFGVAPDEALRRLKAQQASVAATDAIAGEFADRLAGMSIEHSPDYRIVVLLTGNEPVADRSAAGVPIIFRTGAKATHVQAVAAMRRHLIDLRTDLPNARGAGYDQRTGEVVLLVTPEDARRFGIDAIRARAEQVSGVAVRVVINKLNESNMSVDGGGRVEGLNLQTNRRNLCTTAFVVTNGETNAIMTAAHCPDDLTYVDRDGTTVSLPMIGSWGAAYRDVQINGSPNSPEPLFYSNRGAGTLRRLVSWRNVASTRAGDFVCHYGESSGYSCATVELTDYAPPGDLCGGPCSPTWVTVRGPTCVPGDSGGPVFSGEVAFGIAKGINREGGRCLFYYYMSTDYLPAGWRLLVGEAPRPPGRP
jgi:streptogrisin C